MIDLCVHGSLQTSVVVHQWQNDTYSTWETIRDEWSALVDTARRQSTVYFRWMDTYNHVAAWPTTSTRTHLQRYLSMSRRHVWCTQTKEVGKRVPRHASADTSSWYNWLLEVVSSPRGPWFVNRCSHGVPRFDTA